MKNKLFLFAILCLFSMQGSASMINGTPIVCAGSSITLSETHAGTAWTSDDPSIATVTAGAITLVTGIAAGTTNITFTATGDHVTVTVNPLPANITGPNTVCPGLSITLSDITGGGTWSSSNISAGTVDASGHVTGILAGTCIITYKLTATTCKVTYPVTCNPNPHSIDFGGGAHSIMCSNTTITLTDVTTGGTWSTSDPSIATVGTPTGITAPLTSGPTSVGTVTITYMLSTGCYASYTQTVLALPAPITGPTTVCTGGMVTISDASGTGAGTGWSSSNTSIATVTAAGIVTGINAGTVIMTYIKSVYDGCIATEVMTVNTTTAITGTFILCGTGATTQLNDTDPGGTWSSSNVSIATVGSSSGLVTAVSTGTSIITYRLSTGCRDTAIVTVNTSPVSSGPTNNGPVCAGSTVTLSANSTGATAWSWTGSNGFTSALQNPTDAPTVTTTYSLTVSSGGGGCISSVYTTTVIVNASPGPINGATALCHLSFVVFSDDVAGGTWSSSNTSVGTIDASGVFTGINSGTTTISYVLSSGCYATVVATVDGTESPNITCTEDQNGNFGFQNDANGFSSITVNYSADITDGTTTVNVLAASPLTLSSGANVQTFFSIADLAGGYTDPPWTVIGSRLLSITYGGCTWEGKCHNGDRHVFTSTGIGKLPGNVAALSILPNPNDGNFRIIGVFTGSDTKNVRIEVVDMLGKMAYTDMASVKDGWINKQITLGNDIVNGVYLIRVTDEHSSSVIRLFLNR